MEFSSVVFQIWIFISGGGGEQKFQAVLKNFHESEICLMRVKFVFLQSKLIIFSSILNK